MVTTPTTVAPRVTTRVVALVVGAEVVLSAVLASFRLGHKSLGYDEAFSALAAGRGVSGSIDVARHLDANMPLFILGLSVWRVLGDGEVALRAFSALAAAASVVAVYFLAARLFDRRTGMVAGLLVATAPFAVRYSQELRSYSMLVLFVALSTYVFVAAVDTRDTRWFAGYALVTAAAFYVHLAVAFIVLAQLVSLAFLDRRHIPVRKLLGSAAAAGVLLLPLASFVLSAVDAGAAPGNPNWRSVPRAVADVAGGLALFAVFAIVGVVFVATFWSVWQRAGRSREAWHLALLLAEIIVPFVGLLVTAEVQGRGWHARYLIVALPALVTAVAMVVCRIDDRRVFVAVLLGIVVLAGFKIVHWYQGDTEHNWPGAVAYVARHGGAEDGIVFCYPYHRVPFEYYALELPAERRPEPISPADPWSRALHVEDVSSAVASDWVESGPDRIWVMPYDRWRRTGVCDHDHVTEGRDRAVRVTFGGAVLERWDR